MEPILIATRNQGKIREIRTLLGEVGVDVVTPDAAGIADDFDVEETGDTFEQNAELKAKAFANAAVDKYVTLADDSGLCVNALGGDPGVHSKRFFSGTDSDRCEHILKLLSEKKDRSAYFIAVLCMYDPKKEQPEFFEGRVTGHIAFHKKGQSGFGYDPIFIPDGFDQTFAQLGPEIKNTLSHRARALEKMKKFFYNTNRRPMTDPRLTHLAEILVKQCISTNAMEKVWVRCTDPSGLPLATEVYKQAVLLGALPTLDISVEGLNSWFYQHANKKQLNAHPGFFEFQVNYFDKSVMIWAEVNKADMVPVDKKILTLREKINHPFKEALMRKPWVLTDYPTAGMAQSANMNVEELEDFYFSATLQDWTKIEKQMKKLAEVLTNANIHIVGEQTDLRLSTKGRIWIADDWKANMPGGEVFTSPVETEVEGEIYFNYPLQRQGKMMRDIHLWFEKGQVVKATASENQDFLLHLLDTDEGARRFGECAIGGNPGIQTYMNNVLFDEKMAGTIHLALGQSFPECNGKNMSAIHMDMIKNMRIKGSFVKANDKMVLKDGKFVV